MNKPVMTILLAVAAANIGYAVWRTVEGVPLDDSLPLFIAALVCATIAMAVSRTKGRAAPGSSSDDTSSKHVHDDGGDGGDGGGGGD
jgi:hypothetical protein